MTVFHLHRFWCVCACARVQQHGKVIIYMVIKGFEGGGHGLFEPTIIAFT